MTLKEIPGKTSYRKVSIFPSSINLQFIFYVSLLVYKTPEISENAMKMFLWLETEQHLMF